jgi:hypothetical protein
MCAGAQCETALKVHHISPSPAVKGAVAVDLGLCPRCDYRQCTACKTYAISLTARACHHCRYPY